MLSRFSRVRLFVTVLTRARQAPLSLEFWTLEWVALASSRRPSQPRDWTLISYISCIGSWVLYHWYCQPTPLFWPGEWTEEPGGLQSTGSQGVRQAWVRKCSMPPGCPYRRHGTRSEGPNKYRHWDKQMQQKQKLVSSACWSVEN